MGIEQSYNRIVARMIEHVDEGTTDQAASTMEVPASDYTDPERWQQEMDAIFRKVPIFVALSHELPEAGDYKAIKMLDLPLLITRQRGGSVRVMLNVCTHRAMLLVEENSTGKKGVFSCPYHGWTFSCDGSLRGVADAGKFGDVDKSTRGLTQLACYERGGFIFAVLTPGLEVDFEAFLGGMIDDVERLNFNEFTFCGTREMQGANWKVAFDGYLEGYHFQAAHPDTIYPRTFSNIMEFDSYGPHIVIGFPQRKIAQLKEVSADDYYQYENDGYDFIRMFFPNVAIFLAPELTQIAMIIPGTKPSENRTVMHYLHRENLQGEARQDLEKMIDWIWKVVEEEDYGLGLKVQKGLDSGTLKSVVFGRNERANQFFHKLVDHYLSGRPSSEMPSL